MLVSFSFLGMIINGAKQVWGNCIEIENRVSGAASVLSKSVLSPSVKLFMPSHDLQEASAVFMPADMCVDPFIAPKEPGRRNR